MTRMDRFTKNLYTPRIKCEKKRELDEDSLNI